MGEHTYACGVQKSGQDNSDSTIATQLAIGNCSVKMIAGPGTFTLHGGMKSDHNNQKLYIDLSIQNPNKKHVDGTLTDRQARDGKNCDACDSNVPGADPVRHLWRWTIVWDLH